MKYSSFLISYCWTGLYTLLINTHWTASEVLLSEIGILCRWFVLSGFQIGLDAVVYCEAIRCTHSPSNLTQKVLTRFPNVQSVCVNVVEISARLSQHESQISLTTAESATPCKCVCSSPTPHRPATALSDAHRLPIWNLSDDRIAFPLQLHSTLKPH